MIKRFYLILLIALLQGIMVIALALDRSRLLAKIERLEANQVIVYETDSRGGAMGLITQKLEEADGYTVSVAGYGNFLVTKEEYDRLAVGDQVPVEILKRGN